MKTNFFIKYKNLKFILIKKKFLISIIILFLLLIALKSYSKYLFTYSSEFLWSSKEETENKNYIKWVDFSPTSTILEKTAKLDIDSHNNNSDITYNWIELLSYLACKYGGDFKRFQNKDLDKLVEKLNSGQTMADLTKNLKNYSYYYEAYDAILHEFIGTYEVEISPVPNHLDNEVEASHNKKVESSQNNKVESSQNKKVEASGNNEVIDLDSPTIANKMFDWDSSNKNVVSKYGLKAFLPIASKYNFSHYDDFGNSRSYGYRRVHLGNDLMGSVGTPIIAVESGTIEALGWNQYGGWRIGIRSFDKKRYYYYAHLRKDHPYVKTLKEGQTVNAGDVIGYLGMTGYSTKENVNNINVPHLHFGIQLIFDECQKDGVNQIWIDVYHIINFLKKNKSEVYKDSSNNEYFRVTKTFDNIQT